VADAFAVKVHVGLGGDGYAVDFLGGHGFVLLSASDAAVERQDGAGMGTNLGF